MAEIVVYEGMSINECLVVMCDAGLWRVGQTRIYDESCGTVSGQQCGECPRLPQRYFHMCIGIWLLSDNTSNGGGAAVG